MVTAKPVRLVVVVALLAHSPLAAQPVSIWSLERGDRIRVVETGTVTGSSGATTIGQFDALSGDTLRVKLESGRSAPFALGEVNRIGVSRGRTRATKYGVGVGLAIGILVGLSTGDSRENNRGTCDPNTDPRCDFKIGPITVPPGAVTATVAGLAIGGIVGSLIKYEAWNDVKFGIGPQGFTLALTMESRAGNRVRKNSLPSRSIRR